MSLRKQMQILAKVLTKKCWSPWTALPCPFVMGMSCVKETDYGGLSVEVSFAEQLP
jgi:hypothetical protein